MNYTKKIMALNLSERNDKTTLKIKICNCLGHMDGQTESLLELLITVIIKNKFWLRWVNLIQSWDCDLTEIGFNRVKVSQNKYPNVLQKVAH